MWLAWKGEGRRGSYRAQVLGLYNSRDATANGSRNRQIPQRCLRLPIDPQAVSIPYDPGKF